ncbi:CPBP family intramembrane metalloprotease [Acidaminobacter sp. JC074]|uniref:CPBP family intramembrane glutamic endopeptidase n=1 Tax=Acidaminobacter sp. JC074 TaxID=2530199 RepID=UPI001F0D838F|nr:CPBP family intramembrane glutamic endopeptidase [Acidaminobacter sp. JC074]MCH4886074.1 CPBP family intramembrane metalloprotease [Acidaminobacter sp. JC074]
MKVLKMLGKMILVLAIPYVMQLLCFFFAGMAIAIVADPSELEVTQLTERLLSFTPLILLLANIIVIALFFLVHTSKRRHKMTVAYRFNPITVQEGLLATLIGLSSFMVSTGFAALTNIQSLDVETTESLSNLIINDNFLITFLGVGIIAPIAEEIVFRGSLFKNLSEHLNIKWVIGIQALVFSLYHMNIVQAFPTLLIGIALGLMVYYTNSIWPAIIMHILNNSMAVILSNVLPSDFLIPWIGYLLMMLIGLVAYVVLLMYARKNKRVFSDLPSFEVEEILA